MNFPLQLPNSYGRRTFLKAIQTFLGLAVVMGLLVGASL